jgi:kynureninase
MSDLDKWRAEFPILSRSVYMISNSLGAMPRKAAAYLAEYAEVWATRGVRGWEDRWWEMPLEVGNRVARIIGAPPATVSMHENVTTAHMTALSSLAPSADRRRIVCSAMDFPSMIYLYRPRPFEVVGCRASDDLSVSTERMLEAIDRRTAVVAVSNVLFRTSHIMDAAALRRGREVGAAMILDS